MQPQETFAFITNANAGRMIATADPARFNSITEEIWEKKIFSLSNKEHNLLKGLREFFRDPERFLNVFYQKIDVEDTYRYLHPDKQPSYHTTQYCQALTSTYRALYVPEPIRAKGTERVKQFRTWVRNTFPKVWATNEVEDPKSFIMKMLPYFPEAEGQSPKNYESTNSGVKKQINLSLNTLEQEINHFIAQEFEYWKSHREEQHVINEWGYLPKGAIDFSEFKGDTTGWSKDALRTFLHFYSDTFKEPVLERLKAYYMMKYNKSLQFSTSLLEDLGFRKCGWCRSAEEAESTPPSNYSNSNYNSPNDLPF